MINDVIDIKYRNTKDILNIIRFSDGITKKAIARKTDLSFSTVTNLCQELKKIGVLSEEKQIVKSIGRTPFTISLNFQDYCALCIDLQLENILRYAITDLHNNFLVKNTIDISDKQNTLDIAKFAKELIDKSITNNSLEKKQIIGVGISVPAVFDSNDGRLVYSSVRIYENAPLKEEFIKVFNLPVYVDNIANFYALSIYTNFPNIPNIVCMDISQGVGIGVVSEGNLVRGKNGYGTEVAHAPIGDPNKKCQFCGGFGCVETDLSMSGILGRYYPDSDSDSLYVRWEKFIEYLRTNHELAQTISEKIGRLAGRLATILINLFDPDLFFVGGYISDLPVSIRSFFLEEVDLRCAKSRERGIKINFDQNDSEGIFIGISNTIYNGWSPTKKINKYQLIQE